MSWDTGDGSPGEVWVIDNGKKSLVARGERGFEEVTWIPQGTTCQFHLRRPGKKKKSLATVTVEMAITPSLNKKRRKPQSRAKTERESQLKTIAKLEPLLEVSGAEATMPKAEAGSRGTRSPRTTKPFLRADPNPLPMSSSVGSTTISWSTGSGRYGVVYLLGAGGQEISFQGGVEGSALISWIRRGVLYRFRLYEEAGGERVRLAETTVRMGNPRLEVALDVAFLVGVPTVLLGLATALIKGGSRLASKARGASPDA